METLLSRNPKLSDEEKTTVANILNCVASLDIKKANELLVRAQRELGSKAQKVKVSEVIDIKLDIA